MTASHSKILDCHTFRKREGKPLALKNLCTWFDEKTNTLHGMLSVWDEAIDGWRKYHNTAKLGTGESEPRKKG
ncbi:MAG TPA: hypothetical protein VNA25_22245 [Phycisphaerae bacterium]|nr:hypothetical protein [Phycisphaerae bacterium]